MALELGVSSTTAYHEYLWMRVFISWSGPAERRVAEALRGAIETVSAGKARPFVSSQDIAKGKRGLAVIAETLEASDFGIVIVSKQNQHAPWLNFESGAMARALKSPVATILLDLKTSDVTGPIAQFQATIFSDDDDMRELFLQIALTADENMPSKTVDHLFAAEWADVKASWKPSKANETIEPSRGVDDMLGELVTRLRRVEDRLPSNEQIESEQAVAPRYGSNSFRFRIRRALDREFDGTVQVVKIHRDEDEGMSVWLASNPALGPARRELARRVVESVVPNFKTRWLSEAESANN
ncbi:TIR domain-containing protein [Curtobacterium flaccumfaciens]|uniref:TIR domain-containing protein n=1 Tax=Curtobacterium flaccumfaciens TaxID=2035 RepID=UPI0024A9A2BE|nr:TIR domain-containing protein [Curtobacterium flaccumfaciens]